MLQRPDIGCRLHVLVGDTDYTVELFIDQYGPCIWNIEPLCTEDSDVLAIEAHIEHLKTLGEFWNLPEHALNSWNY